VLQEWGAGRIMMEEVNSTKYIVRTFVNVTMYPQHNNNKKKEKNYYILIKRTIQQEDITILHIHAQNIGSPKFTEQTVLSLKEQMGPDTIIATDPTTHSHQQTKHPSPKLTNIS
jgi:hypothetical protein